MLSFSTSLSMSVVNTRFESCIDLRDEDEEELSSRNRDGRSGERSGRRDIKKNEFSSLMLRLDLLLHMMWVMEMYYSRDG